MRLLDIVQRTAAPAPWQEGDNIPWNEPGFSERMLKEHLSQAHDAASRRTAKIDAHVDWIHRTVLQSQPTRILDLGCGPGLYASRLARLGHTCEGIDFSPASIQYAVERAREENLRCGVGTTTYRHQDIRQAEFGAGFGLAMLLFGEFNVFRPADARHILEKANRALVEGGLLVLEPHTCSAVRAIGEQPAAWYSSAGGLWSSEPHLCLEEHFWDAPSAVATVRHWIVDAASADVARYAASYQAYTDEQYRSLLIEYGFEPEFFPSLTGQAEEFSAALMAIVARKQHTI
jgi:SAM-dependent methyltransferase